MATAFFFWLYIFQYLDMRKEKNITKRMEFKSWMLLLFLVFKLASLQPLWLSLFGLSKLECSSILSLTLAKWSMLFKRQSKFIVKMDLKGFWKDFKLVCYFPLVEFCRCICMKVQKYCMRHLKFQNRSIHRRILFVGR